MPRVLFVLFVFVFVLIRLEKILIRDLATLSDMKLLLLLDIIKVAY